MILPNSPLVFRPRGLEPKQRLSLDAIRVSAHSVGISYERLIGNLANSKDQFAEKTDWGLRAILDAWSIIDSVHRLRELVKKMPRYRSQAPSKQIFLRATTGAEDLRNSIQHLNKDIETLLQSGRPPFGALTWIVPVNRDEGTMYVHSFIPGQLEGANPGSSVAVPAQVPECIDQVELWASEYRVNLSEHYRSVSKLVSKLDATLRNQFSDLAHGPADTHISMLVQVLPVEDESGE